MPPALPCRDLLATDDTPRNFNSYTTFPWCKCERSPARSPIRLKYTSDITFKARKYACFAIYVDTSRFPISHKCGSMDVHKVEFDIGELPAPLICMATALATACHGSSTAHGLQAI